jgi:hypothetical protein
MSSNHLLEAAYVAAQGMGPPHRDPPAIIKRTLAFLHPRDAVYELCIIGAKTPRSPLFEGFAGGKKPIVAGWFRDQDKAVALAAQVQAEGVYITMNDLPPEN